MTSTERPLPLTDGRFVVPANRWDLLEGNASRAARVGVVIPHYEQPHQLALVLGALALQDYPHELIEVVVADDGSATPPNVAECDLRVTVVRQDDLGFRAAAARNLGAAATSAELLCFLDADTIPEPGYVRHLTRLPSILPDAVSVGRRRHADLQDWSPDRLTDWWSGQASPPILREPRWLAEAYDASSDLLHVDRRSYRHVISAVMCCTRELFDEIGGFDESFREYGGEDWEFAHRAMVNGAVLSHARDAVAWHDGPDWSDRDVADRVSVKNREALAMARLIPDPLARRSGLHYHLPGVAIEIDVATHTAASLIATMACFQHEDVGIWLAGPDASALLDETGIDDSRIHAGPVPEFVTRRCPVRVTTIGRPTLPAEAFTELLRACFQDSVGEVRTAGLVVEASWAAHRRRRWTHGAVRLSEPSDATNLATVVTIPAESLGVTPIEPEPDLSW